MHHPEFDLWRHQRWENPVSRRYYEAWLLKNLFGDWEIVCHWGGIGANTGNSKAYPANSRDVALELFQTIHKRRLKRQYYSVTS